MGILSEIGDLLVGDVAVCEDIGNVLVVWSVGVVELGGVEFEPFQNLVCRCEGVKVGWRSPTVEWATNGRLWWDIVRGQGWCVRCLGVDQWVVVVTDCGMV